MEIDLAMVASYRPAGGGPFVEGTLEFWEFVKACAATAGAVVEIIPGNPPGVRWNDETDRTRQVVDACIEHGQSQDWVIPSPFDGSAAGNELLYELWIEVHGCLQANGYPTVDPPSKDTFVTTGADIWNPYAAMGGAPLVDATGGASASDPRYQAQEMCGADPNVLYQELIADDR